MSLFQAREYWGTSCGIDEEFCDGSMCVANVDNASDGQDKIVTGSLQGVLRIYLPRGREFSPDDLLLEKQCDDPIVQVEAGRFIPQLNGLALGVLFLRKFVVYATSKVEGKSSDQGSYLVLEKAFEHDLERSACNFCFGPFGGVYGRDFVCVQSIDGMVTVFEQDAVAFHRFLPNFLLPGPLCYVERIDSIITFNSSMELECYKYQNLAMSNASSEKELDPKAGGKRVKRDWGVNIGEQALSIHVARFSRSLTASQLEILVLCERALFCVKENGSIRLQKMFDHNPSCVVPFDIDSEESVSMQNIIVGSNSKALLVYRDMQLAWSARVEEPPIALAVSRFCDLKGLIVSLTDKGRLSLQYLGTDPASVIHATETRETDYDQMEKDLKYFQRRIREITTKSDSARQVPISDGILVSLADSRIVTEDERAESPDSLDEENATLGTCVMITLNLRKEGRGTFAEGVNITINADSPFYLPRTQFVIEKLIGGFPTPAAVSFPVYCKVPRESVLRGGSHLLPHNPELTVATAFTDDQSELRATNYSFSLPLTLIGRVVPPVKNARYKVTLSTNRPPLNVSVLFSDLVNTSETGSIPPQGNVLTFRLPSGHDATVLVSKNAGRYRVQGDDFAALYPLLWGTATHLNSYFSGDKDLVNPYRLSYDDALPLQEFFDVVDNHHQLRLRQREINATLARRAEQYRAVEKRLLVRFKDKNPTPLAGLDELLTVTHHEIMDAANDAAKVQQQLELASSKLACAVRLLNILIKCRFNLSNEDSEIIEAHISPIVVDGSEQGWEELTDAAVTQLLRSQLAKSAKDQGSLPQDPVLTDDTSVLKKRIAIVCDRLSKGLRPHKEEKETEKEIE